MTQSRVRTALSAAVGIVWPPLLLFVAVIGAWQAYVSISDIPTVILPSPAEVAVAGITSAPVLIDAALVTGSTAAIGLTAGTVVGLSLAFAMVVSRTAASIIHPYLVALRIAPLVAIAPLLFLWFGSGLFARAALVATLTTFPVAVASLDGLRSTPEAYRELARSVDAPAHAIFLRIRVPAAAPSVFAGIKLAAALSVIGTVVTEFLTLRAGLGYQVFHASTALDTAGMFAALVALSGLGLGFYGLPALLEARISWTSNP